LGKKTSKIRKLNDAHARVYDAITNFPFYREHLDQIMAELGLERGKLYLDLGCGTGNLLAAAKKAGVPFIGVDLSAGMLKKAKRKGKDLAMADLHRLPFRGGCIDGITNVNVFYQLDRPKTFLKEAHRVLKPGGKVVISTPRPSKTPMVLRFVPELMKTFTRDPKLLTKVKKMTEYGRIDKQIIDLNPSTFYSREELEAMLGDFEIQNIKKAYGGENWLVSVRKPSK
jgi:ubiquinone/menaquinone biosynthesis C-methylase UbiE